MDHGLGWRLSAANSSRHGTLSHHEIPTIIYTTIFLSGHRQMINE